MRRTTLLRIALAATAVAATAPAAAQARPGHKTPAVGATPHYRYAGTLPKIGTVLFRCQSRRADIGCYGPDQIRSAYGFKSVLAGGIDGSGQTIVIVDAFQSPTIAQDLQLFDAAWGLPDPTLNIIAPDGLTPFDPTSGNQVGWSAEISLDVEWAHAIAPGATIDLVLAKSNDDADILSATKYAVDNHLGSVISQSFGEAEQCMDPALLLAQHALFEQATAANITLLASSGDDGAAQPTCDGSSLFLAASTPASDPDVTGVGGTHLNAHFHTGHYLDESAWNDEFGATGGGFSVIYSKPAFQQGVNQKTMRGVPDVAYNGDVDNGVLVAWGVPFGVGAFFIFGGTSSGSPQWAGLVALANEMAGHDLGFLNDTLYSLGTGSSSSTFFHDIVRGNNRVRHVGGFHANNGWDATTGLGTPIANNLIPALAGS